MLQEISVFTFIINCYLLFTNEISFSWRYKILLYLLHMQQTHFLF